METLKLINKRQIVSFAKNLSYFVVFFSFATLAMIEEVEKIP